MAPRSTVGDNELPEDGEDTDTDTEDTASTNGSTPGKKGKARVGMPPAEGRGYIGLPRPFEQAIHTHVANKLGKSVDLVTGDERQHEARIILASAIGYTGDLEEKPVATGTDKTVKAMKQAHKAGDKEAIKNTFLELARQMGMSTEELTGVLS